MEKYNEVFLNNNLFMLDNTIVESVIDIEHPTPYEKPIRTIKLWSRQDKQVRFAYVSGDGLVRLNAAGSIEESNILTRLISLPSEDMQSILNFFNVNGFLFPIRPQEFEVIDEQILFDVVNRIKATVQLMSESAQPTKNYDKILHLTLYLLLTDSIEVSLSNMDEVYKSAEHPISRELKFAPNITHLDKGEESFYKDTYTIKDTVYPPTFELDINLYNEVISGYNSTNPGHNDNQFKNILKIYCNRPMLSENLRMIIDFLFHYQNQVAVIKEVSFERGILYYSAPNKSKFDKYLKTVLLKIAQQTIGVEINHNLKSISPKYDIHKMAPSWNVNNLMSAVYFSIFYMRPGMELYKECENPNCKQYFLIKTTSTRRKYCCPECANATAQRNYRKRKKEQGII